MTEHKDLKPILDILAERVRERRKALGLTQEKLAERAGLSVNYLAQIEISDKTPSLKTLASLAEALEIDIRDLFAASSQDDQWQDEVHNLLRSLKDMKESDVRFAMNQLRELLDYLKWDRDKDCA